MTDADNRQALIEEINEDARKKAARITRRAESEAAEIVEKAKREAEAAAQQTLEAAQKKAEAERDIILATVAVDAKRIEMDIKELPVGQAFTTAEESIARREFNYAESIAHLVAAAARELGDEEVHVRLRRADQDLLDTAKLSERVVELLGRSIRLVFEADEAFPDGVVVSSLDGRRICDNTFESRMRRMRSDIRREVAKIIYNL